ncbi:MAG: efflux RND transporter periplasmic adaptor subunit [Vicinamibacteria bacterium]|jgi:cobalt-zinc-cadmium efflux system membrane fusion protein|nr:efflux RND transporter periplasmic adaptor subunit [Vicinamibacteria bacterium]
MKRLVHVSFLGLLAAAASGCGKAPTAAPAIEEKETNEAHEEIPGRVTMTAAALSEAGIATWQVKPVDLEHLLVLTGSVAHDENRLLQVASNVGGRVAAIPVDLGAWVRKGDPILELESVELGRAREEFVKELAEHLVATRAYERAKKLVEAKAISGGEFQTREGDYLAKKAAVEAAERALHLSGDSEEEVARLRARLEARDESFDDRASPRLVLRAPFDGRVVDRKVTPGALVEALQPLVTVANLGSVWIFLQAYEKDLAPLHDGLSVTIRTEAYPQETFGGRIDFVGSSLDTTTRTVRVRATVQNRGEKLKPGMFVKAHVDVPRPAAEAKATLVVPQSALQTLEGRTTLFVQVEPGVFERHFVEVGHSFEGFTEILSGLKTGDVVVTEGSFVMKSEFAKASLAEEH